MKKKSDPRHKQRVIAVKKLFERNFRPDLKVDKNSLAEKITENQPKIDKLIKKYAPAWPIEQIPPVDLTVLRLAIWELEFKKEKVPYKVIVDEAVELAKEFGSESSSSFVNGVLGTIIKSGRKERKD